MESIVNENGKAYKIENGRVVAAVNTKEAKTVAQPLKHEDRVLHGKKLGKVISIIPSVYGNAIGVRFDDGSFVELPEDVLEVAQPEKVAKVAGLATAEAFKQEYDEYVAMPQDTLDEVEDKKRVARQLNLRAKAASTNRQNALADTILYDQIVTGTGVDILDLDQQQEAYRVAESREYLEQMPTFQLPETVSPGFGMTSGGDASWLQDEELEIAPVEDAHLASLAAHSVAQLEPEQLEDDEFMRQVIQYRFSALPEDQSVRTKFAGLLNEARKAKLSAKEEPQKIASTVPSRDLDGNEFDLDDVPVEAVFGS